MSAIHPPEFTDGLGLFAEPEVIRQIHRTSLAEYHHLGDLGVLREKTELIRGIIVDKVPKSPLHAWLTQKLTDWLKAGIGEGWTVRPELPLTLVASESEPEPDISVVPGKVDDYFAHHPTTAALAIEIAISTEKLDREKAFIYAESGFKEYWLFLPLKQQLVRHLNPAKGRYQTVDVLTVEDVVSPAAFPNLALELKGVLPEIRE